MRKAPEDRKASGMPGRAAWTIWLGLQLTIAIRAWIMPTPLAAFELLFISYVLSVLWRGSFNGGSDAMTFHLLLAWAISLCRPEWEQSAALYVVALTVTSYFASGVAKACAGGWWNGETLKRALDSHAAHPGLLRDALRSHPWSLVLSSWATLIFELSFPLVLFRAEWRPAFLLAGIGFHFANYCLFGLNRFFWIWLAAYPAFL
jgi:hypothetical protein